MIWMLVAGAMAGDLNPSFDRGGPGESTGTPGVGHLIAAGAVSMSLDPTTVATSTVMVRVGVLENVELRARLPDLTVAGGPGIGSIHVGAKVASDVGDRLSISVVPELLVDPTDGGIGVYVGSNVAFDMDTVNLWANSGLTLADGGVAVVAGGAMSVGVGPHAVYVNAMAGVGTPGFVGAGGWLGLAPNVQLDVGVDVYLLNDQVWPLFTVGLAMGI